MKKNYRYRNPHNPICDKCDKLNKFPKKCVAMRKFTRGCDPNYWIIKCVAIDWGISPTDCLLVDYANRTNYLFPELTVDDTRLYDSDGNPLPFSPEI